jgi:hypothetical protein
MNDSAASIFILGEVDNVLNGTASGGFVDNFFLQGCCTVLIATVGRQSFADSKKQQWKRL